MTNVLRTRTDAEHVCYEVDMLVATADALCEPDAACYRAATTDWGALNASKPSVMTASTGTVKWSASLAGGRQAADPMQIRRHAMLEAFLVHFRCLAEFLSKRETNYGDEVLAVLFFDNLADWPKIPKEHTIREWQGKAHWYLSHISANRASNPDWPYATLRMQVLQALGSFLDLLGTKHPERASWFSGLRRHIPPCK